MERITEANTIVLLCPIHNHLDTEPCTEKCPNFRAIQKCPLCVIPTRETLLYEDDHVYLVSTKEQKGHKVRVMVATKRHTVHPTFAERAVAHAVLINYMNSLMLDSNQDWYVIDDTFASVPEHWHMIACDFPLEEESDPLFHKTPKVHFPLKDKTVLIGIPARNEECTLQSIIVEAKKHGDVLVVDDGSTDNTHSIIIRNCAHIITHDSTCGYGASLHDMFRFAKAHCYDILVTLDADGQHDPSEISRFIHTLKSADVVTGNRFMGESNISAIRKFGVKTISKLSGISDAQCGFRAYSKRAIALIADHMYEKGMGASTEILKIAQDKKLKIIEVPCNVTYNKKEHSHSLLIHGADVLRAMFWSAVWDKPLKSLFPMGSAFFAIAVLALVQTINLYMQFHTVVMSWAFIALGSFICTLLIFNILMFVLILKNKKVS